VQWRFSVTVVSEASAHHDMDKKHAISKNHMQICKMASHKDTEYKSLVTFLKERLKVAKQVHSQTPGADGERD
jgi:hypothetical protein